MNLRAAKRMVIKVGSALLVDGKTGTFRHRWMEALCDDIVGLRAEGTDVIIVSSGAIALGRHLLKLEHATLRLADKQAAAAIGQIRLSQYWEASLARRELVMAQILLTLEDIENRRRFLNARGTLDVLLGVGAVPVINENDTVATGEIRFGDNDRLAAKVAHMTGADCLVLLSDIDGLYAQDPRKNPQAAFVAEVSALTPEILAMAGAAPSKYSSGGMVTKLAAAKIATGSGCTMIIAQGRDSHPLQALLDGARHTIFRPTASPRAARQQWILTSLAPGGEIVVDAGAARALGQGKNLLAAGVVRVVGDFKNGDTVRLRNEAGDELGLGLAAYSAEECRKLVGAKTTEIESRLGYSRGNALIHSHDMVLHREQAYLN